MAKRVLISSANLRSGNGIASCIMSYYDGLIKSGYQVDFILQNDVPSKYMERVRNNNGQIFLYPHSTGKYNKENENFIRGTIADGRYDIIHNNLTGLNGALLLKTAKKCGVKNRIHHSHNPHEKSSVKAWVRSIIFDPMCVKASTKGIACSSLAGDSVFGKNKYEILPNAIDPKNFIYDQSFRDGFRKEYNLENTIAIGTVCRHAEQKNPYFIVDVFNEIVKEENSSRLVWVGSGPLMADVQKYIDDKGLHDYIIMLGARQDVGKIYSAMDLFFLPSLFEGLGMVFIEAQTSGLYCVASDVVPEDTDVTGNIEYLSLKKDSTYWAKMILERVRELPARGDYSQKIAEHGFDIRQSNSKLAEIYDALI